jgi:voltage-gated potassium channel
VDFYEPSARESEEDLRELRARMMAGLAFLMVVTAVGTIGFKVIDPSGDWVRAFFMTAITLTTVGYGEVVPLETDGARIFAAMLIFAGMGAVLYFVSTGTAFVLEGQLGHVFRRRRMEKELATLDRHLLVCGSGQTAIYTAQELVSVKRPVVMIVDRPERVGAIRAVLEGVPILVGDPSEDDILSAAGVERAAGLIACTDSDKENLVIVLTARQLNPDIRIISRVLDLDSEDKIRKVGADSIVSPNFIGGLRMASELIRPTVVDFLDAMLRHQDLNLRIDEVGIPHDSRSVGLPLNELGLEQTPHALLIATRTEDGTWEYNPARSSCVTAGMILIFLCSPEDSRALCERLGGEMIVLPHSES